MQVGGGFRHEFRVVPDILALFHSELPILKSFNSYPALHKVVGMTLLGF